MGSSHPHTCPSTICKIYFNMKNIKCTINTLYTMWDPRRSHLRVRLSLSEALCAPTSSAICIRAVLQRESAVLFMVVMVTVMMWWMWLMWLMLMVMQK